MDDFYMHRVKNKDTNRYRKIFREEDRKIMNNEL